MTRLLTLFILSLMTIVPQVMAVEVYGPTYAWLLNAGEGSSVDDGLARGARDGTKIRGRFGFADDTVLILNPWKNPSRISRAGQSGAAKVQRHLKKRPGWKGTSAELAVPGVQNGRAFAAPSLLGVVNGDSSTIVSLAPATANIPAINEQLTFDIDIARGKNVAGYQFTLHFDPGALRFVSIRNENYLPGDLPDDLFIIPPVVSDSDVTFAATSLTEENNGDGTLASITFVSISDNPSILRLSDVVLSDSAGAVSRPRVEGAEVVGKPEITEDINGDGVVNIQDLVLVASWFGLRGEHAADVNGDGIVNIADLVLVGRALGNAAGAPARTDVQQWLIQAQQLDMANPVYHRGILKLQQLLAALTPKATALLPNYPNPFNPETWIPYQLAEAAEVTLRLYTANGTLIRTLALGHQPVGMYHDRHHAAYWDGRNEFGEPVASGVYFYSLTAGNFTATRKMLVRK